MVFTKILPFENTYQLIDVHIKIDILYVRRDMTVQGKYKDSQPLYSY